MPHLGRESTLLSQKKIPVIHLSIIWQVSNMRIYQRVPIRNCFVILQFRNYHIGDVLFQNLCLSITDFELRTQHSTKLKPSH